MDYNRIYADFIKDRRAKEGSLEGYVERHHIVPRSLGGSDDPDNLINLTFEDHYFAHLLLARIHGGKMASALWIMVNSSRARWRSRHHARRAYAAAKRYALSLMAEAWTAEGNPLFNPEVFDWTNYRTGCSRRATMYEMHREVGGSRPHWTNVATGQRPSYRGWLLTKNLATHKRSEKGQKFLFVNRDGREFFGTQAAFARAHKVSFATACRIVHQQSVSRCGWRREGVMDRRFNMPRSGENSGRKPTIFTLERDGIRIAGDRTAIAAAMGSTARQISAAMYAIRNGKVAAYKGWRLVKEETPDARAA